MYLSLHFVAAWTGSHVLHIGLHRRKSKRAVVVADVLAEVSGSCIVLRSEQAAKQSRKLAGWKNKD